MRRFNEPVPASSRVAVMIDSMAADIESQTIMSSADQNVYWIERTIRESIPTVFEWFSSTLIGGPRND